MEPVFAAIETMKAKWWELWLARIFGKKTVGTDSGCTVTMHRWRGKSYMTGCKHTEHYTGMKSRQVFPCRGYAAPVK